MVASTLITDYLSEGLHSARPAAPNIPTGATALYYETDTTDTFAWSGSAWVKINGTGGGGSPPTIVQAAVNAGASINTVTLGSAPTAGNLLVAFSQGGNSGTLGAGWQTGFAADGGGINLSFTTWKIAGSGESATQSPFTTAQASCITIFELANATVLRPNYSDATTASATINADATGTQGLIIGAACAETVAVLPTSIAGATGGATATGTGNAVQLFSLASPLLGVAANLITVNYLAAHPIRLSACFIGGA